MASASLDEAEADMMRLVASRAVVVALSGDDEESWLHLFTIFSAASAVVSMTTTLASTTIITVQ